MESDNNTTGGVGTPQKPKRPLDKVSCLSLGFGLASILFSFIGAIPIVAIVLGIIGITRTKESYTGRDFAVAGLILGIIFMIVNAYQYGHLDNFLNNNSQERQTFDNYTPVLSPQLNTDIGDTQNISEKNELRDTALGSKGTQNNTVKDNPINAETEIVLPPTPSAPLIETNQEIDTNQDYKKLEDLSASLTQILNDLKQIENKMKSESQKNLSMCKSSYDTEVARVNSQWNSDLKYYESQKSYYNSNSGLYSMTGTSQQNADYLAEQYTTISERKESGLVSARTSYDSCKKSYEFDTSLSKEISSISNEQKTIMGQKLNGNIIALVTQIQSLINRCKNLKESLLYSF
ncbi:MAG: hypothetical protein RLZZ70_148 [Candidatus Parcubacteria bacterium]